MAHIWINAGELSGDMHGAALLTALREQDPSIHAVGMGGLHLAGAGMHTLLRVESLSVMGGTEIVCALPRIWRMLRRIRTELCTRHAAGQLDALVLIDAPEFNFRVARMARDLGVPVYYHIPPKVWAWRTGRVKFLRKTVRKLLCILPFEPAFYRSHGLGDEQIAYIGNPLIDMYDWPSLDAIAPLPHQIGIMPGSRRAEVRSLMPVFAQAATRLQAQRAELEFVCLRAPNMTEASLRSLWTSPVPLRMIEPQQRYEGMRSCAFLLAASGTATLEAALAGTPTLIAYKLSRLSYELARRLIKVQWAGLPNLILGREVFPECLQDMASPEHLANLAANWLDHPEQLYAVRTELEQVRTLCGPPGAAARAARVLLDDLSTLRGEHAHASKG